jgi:hypothetical protein
MDAIVGSDDCESSEAVHERSSTIAIDAISLGYCAQEKLRCRRVHRKSTRYPQVFNTASSSKMRPRVRSAGCCPVMKGTAAAEPLSITTRGSDA